MNCAGSSFGIDGRIVKRDVRVRSNPAHSDLKDALIRPHLTGGGGTVDS